MPGPKGRAKKRHSYRPRIPRKLKSYILDKLRQTDDRSLIAQVTAWFEELTKSKSELLGKRSLRAFAALAYRLRKSRHLTKAKTSNRGQTKHVRSRKRAAPRPTVPHPTMVTTKHGVVTQMIVEYLDREDRIRALRAENESLLVKMRGYGASSAVVGGKVTVTFPISK